jgi:hypothetical protein
MLGGKDCSIYASIPLALDEDAMTLLINAAKSNWRKFRRAWLQAWLSWTEKMREFWNERILRERFRDEVRLILPRDLTPIHFTCLTKAGDKAIRQWACLFVQGSHRQRLEEFHAIIESCDVIWMLWTIASRLSVSDRSRTCLKAKRLCFTAKL